MSTRFIKVCSTREAWDLVRVLVSPVVADLGYSDLHALPGFVKDDSSSARAGYSVYRLEGWDLIDDDATEKLFYNYVSDLGGVLELNTCGADWSGDVYRIAIVSDGDGLQGSGVNSAEGSAAAGAIPAEGSQSGAGDPDLVALRLPRTDVQRVLLAILSVKSKNITEALSLDVDDPRRGACIQYAREWDALRRGVRLQLADYDARRGCGVDPWEVA